MNTITRSVKPLACIATALAMLPIQAAPGLHDLGDIVATARATLTANAPSALIEIAPLDPRVRLPQCGSALRASLPVSASSTASRMAVRVQCDGPTPWNVAVTAEVSTDMPVVVAARALRTGQAVSPADLEIVTRRVRASATVAPPSSVRSSGRRCVAPSVVASRFASRHSIHPPRSVAANWSRSSLATPAWRFAQPESPLAMRDLGNQFAFGTRAPYASCRLEPILRVSREWIDNVDGMA